MIEWHGRDLGPFKFSHFTTVNAAFSAPALRVVMARDLSSAPPLFVVPSFDPSAPSKLRQRHQQQQQQPRDSSSCFSKVRYLPFVPSVLAPFVQGILSSSFPALSLFASFVTHDDKARERCERTATAIVFFSQIYTKRRRAVEDARRRSSGFSALYIKTIFFSHQTHGVTLDQSGNGHVHNFVFHSDTPKDRLEFWRCHPKLPRKNAPIVIALGGFASSGTMEFVTTATEDQGENEAEEERQTRRFIVIFQWQVLRVERFPPKKPFVAQSLPLALKSASTQKIEFP